MTVQLFNMFLTNIYKFKFHHFFKNLLIYFPIFFNGEIINNFDLVNISKYFFGFFLFSITSYLIYLFNDWHDYQEDNKAKNKNIFLNFDIKQENIPILLFVYLLIYTAFILLFIKEDNSLIHLILISYICLNAFYNLKLKYLKNIDIVTVSFFYILRLIFGYEYFDIGMNIFEFTFIFCLSFFLVVNKRIIYKVKLKFKKINDYKRDIYNLAYLKKLSKLSLFSTLFFFTILMFSIQKINLLFFLINGLFYILMYDIFRKTHQAGRILIQQTDYFKSILSIKNIIFALLMSSLFLLQYF